MDLSIEIWYWFVVVDILDRLFVNDNAVVVVHDDEFAIVINYTSWQNCATIERIKLTNGQKSAKNNFCKPSMELEVGSSCQFVVCEFYEPEKPNSRISWGFV